MDTSSQNWLDDTLKRISDVRVAVFGDFCLDAYWIIDADLSEVSVETGKPVWRTRQQAYSLGGAGNNWQPGRAMQWTDLGPAT